MASGAETTFGSLEIDERYKKLERCLKLALLKGKCSKNMHNRVEQSIPTWPSISSINADTVDSSCISPSLQVSKIETEVLASSNNLKNIFSKKKAHNMNTNVIATSSVKQYNIKQDNHVDQCIMPPPSVNKVYHTSKKRQNGIYVSSECGKSASIPLNSSIQSSVINSKTDTMSYMSVNTYNSKEYVHSLVTSSKDLPKPERIFSKWKVMLNDQHQLIIKGTLECGKVARSKPVIRRYSATRVESIFKHQYHLQGNITDERNELPDYIRGKFYNGFPDDWENVYQIWRTFVSQGCLVTFRWPTPITDSDDDLKSEITDFTYICKTGNKNNTRIRLYKMIEPTAQVIQLKDEPNELLEKAEERYNCTHSTQSYRENQTFVKSVVSNTEKDNSLAAQASNTSNKEYKQNTKTNVNQPCSPKKINKFFLKDFLQEDKLNTIINNLADRNCSPKYIDKVIEMFGCLDYVTSYKTETEYDFNSVSENCNMFKSEAIPLEQISVYNKENDTNDKNLEKRTKSQIHSCDLGYGSIKNDTDPSQLESNMRNNDRQEHEDSDKSESETYAGIPKISIERILRVKASRKLPKRKVKKKTIQLDQQMHEQHNANVKHNFDVHTAISIGNIQKKNLPNESCVSITEEEVEASENTKTHQRVANILRKPQETTFGSHQIQRLDSDVHTENTISPITHIQRNMHESFSNRRDFIQPQRIESSVFTKEQNSREMQKKRQLQFTDVDYTTSSDVEENVATATNMGKTIEPTRVKSHVDLRRDVAIVNNKNDNNFPDESHISQESRNEYADLPKNELAVTKAKPTIISSIPLMNFHLKVTKADVHRSAMLHELDVSITDNKDKQCTNVRLVEETKKPRLTSKASNVVNPTLVANKSPSKTKVDINKENHQATSNITSNVKNESDSRNPIGATKSKITTRQSKKQIHANKPKVLTAWIPKVVYHSTSKTELGLTFRGKLLNEAGHIIHRNFITEIVLRRLSPTLIETVNHEIYQLLGSLNDSKHVLPKEIVKQCHHGCPAKIEQFCLMWKSLQKDKVEEVGEKLHNATMDTLTVPISSRGRRILPPLCYWTGERIALKDNTPVYSLGNSKESSLISLNESPTKHIETNKKQKMGPVNTSKNSVTKQKLLSETNEISSTNKDQIITIESPKAKTADNVKKSRKPTANGKRRVAQQLTTSSSDSDNEKKYKMSPRKRLFNSNEDAKIQPRYSMTLRKRPKMEIQLNGSSHEDISKSKKDAAHCLPTRKPYGHNMEYAYYQSIPQEDLLSEDQVSPI